MALGIGLGVFVNTVDAQSIPVPPLRIWGSITSNLTNGYVVGTVSGATCAKGALFSGSSYGLSTGQYLNFPGDIPSTTVVEGAIHGQTINVFIDPAEPSTTTYKTGGGIIALPGAPISATSISERMNVSIGSSASGAIYTVSGNVSSSGLGAVSDATVNINWGDGTVCTQTFSSGGTYNGVHGYDADGIYTITVIAYKNGIGAGLSNTLISVITVVAPTATPDTSQPTFGGGGFFAPPPAATPTPTLDELLELTVEESVDQFNDADAEAVAGWISKLSASRSAAIFELMDIEKVIEVFATLTAETATAILEEINLSKAAEIMFNLDEEKAGEIFSGLTSETAGNIFDLIAATKIAAILVFIDSTVAADIFNYVSDDKAVAILENTDPSKSAEILVLVKLSKAVGIIELIDVNKGALIFEVIEVEKGAFILDKITALKSADLLSIVSAFQAGTIMEHIQISSLSNIIKYMPERKMIYRLPVMSAERFHELPAKIVLQVLSSVPAEAITKEVAPIPVGKKPEVVLSSPGSSVYQQPGVSEGQWFTIISSPHPLDRVVAKFDEETEELFITIRDQDPNAIGVPVAQGESLYAAFNIGFDGDASDKLVLGHIRFYVEKTWLDQKNIHKWAIQLKRYDETIGKWVSYSAKRVTEDADKIYYTVAVPAFANMAVIGSNSIPEPQFTVSNLGISPIYPISDEDFNVTARVVNNASDTLIYPANLWIDDTIQSSQSIEVNPGQNVTFKFVSNKKTGKYGLRIERILASFQVRAEVIPVITTITPRPKPTPIAAPGVTPQPTPRPLVKGVPTATATPLPVPVATATPKPTPMPTATAVPVATAAAVAVIKDVPTSVPTPTPTPTSVPDVLPIEEEGAGNMLLWIIIVIIVLGILGGIGFVFMRRRGGQGGPGGTSPTSDTDSNYTELDDLISGNKDDAGDSSKE